jgi:hypothetical protein
MPPLQVVVVISTVVLVDEVEVVLVDDVVVVRWVVVVLATVVVVGVVSRVVLGEGGLVVVALTGGTMIGCLVGGGANVEAAVGGLVRGRAGMVVGVLVEETLAGDGGVPGGPGETAEVVESCCGAGVPGVDRGAGW